MAHRWRMVPCFLLSVAASLWTARASGEDPDTAESSWATYQWAQPWHGSWATHTVHSPDSLATEESLEKKLPEKKLLKRHYLHYIPPSKPEELERPRKRHFENDKDVVYYSWEQPPLLAKEGITSEEAVWVPQDEPLQVIQQGYTWGSKEFDHSFSRHPPLIGDTYLGYGVMYPHPPTPSHPLQSSPYPPPPPSTLPSTLPTTPDLPPSTSPPALHSIEIAEPVPKIKKSHHVPSYPPPLLHYHSLPNYSNIPRKYYLTEEAPETYSHQYGLRKYFLDEGVKVQPGAEDIIERPTNLRDDRTLETSIGMPQGDSLGSVPGNNSDPGNENTPEHELTEAPHTSHSPLPYGYKLQPRRPNTTPSQAIYKPPPYGHFLNQSPQHHGHHLYHPTPGTLRKYYLNPPNTSVFSSAKIKDSPKAEKNQEKDKAEITSSFDVYEMLRMPRSALVSPTSWQRTRFGKEASEG